MSSNNPKRLTDLPKALDELYKFPGPPKSLGNIVESGKGEPLRTKQPRIPIAVRTDETLFSDAAIWEKYHRFWEDNEAGSAIIAHEKTPDHKIVVVKQIMVPDGSKQLDKLKKVSHPNIVQLLDAYSTISCIFLVYESLETSLHSVQATSRGELTEIEMAIICKELLQGITYIHNELDVTLGKMDSQNILLSYQGCDVKIANIADCILRPQRNRKSEDVRAIGALVVSLKEPGTSSRSPGTLQFENPHGMSETFKDFIQKSASSSAEKLLKHEFLLKSPGTGRLRLFIFRAMRCAKRHPISSFTI